MKESVKKLLELLVKEGYGVDIKSNDMIVLRKIEDTELIDFNTGFIQEETLVEKPVEEVEEKEEEPKMMLQGGKIGTGTGINPPRGEE